MLIMYLCVLVLVMFSHFPLFHCTPSGSAPLMSMCRHSPSSNSKWECRSAEGCQAEVTSRAAHMSSIVDIATYSASESFRFFWQWWVASQRIHRGGGQVKDWGVVQVQRPSMWVPSTPLVSDVCLGRSHDSINMCRSLEEAEPLLNSGKWSRIALEQNT